MAFVPIALGLGAASVFSTLLYKYVMSGPTITAVPVVIQTSDNMLVRSEDNEVIFETLNPMFEQIPLEPMKSTIITTTSSPSLHHSVIIPKTLCDEIIHFDRSKMKQVTPQGDNLVKELKNFKIKNLKKTIPRILPKRFRNEFYDELEKYRRNKKLV